MPTGKNSKKAKVIIVDDSSDDLTNNLAELNLNKETTEGYETDTEESVPKEKKMRPRRRLLIGEADMSYGDALLNKHPEIAKSVTVTAYEKREALLETYPDTFKQHKENIKAKQAKIFYDVDARKLHEHQTFKDNRYERIHFNCPHDKSDYNDQTLPKLLKEFFESASQLQQVGNRVHIALPKIVGDKQRDEFYKGCVYGIYTAARLAGYKQCNPRKFGADRFPGYEHKITGVNGSAAVTGVLREYIFEKTDLSPAQILENDKNSEHKPVRRSFYLTKTRQSFFADCLPTLPTESESSDYLTTDSESENEATPAPVVPKFKPA